VLYYRHSEERDVEYTLIMKNGKQMQFYVLSLAETYQTIYGGVLLKNNRPMLALVDKLAA
jgi:hypothetical protein